jgi:hypothetical protein
VSPGGIPLSDADPARIRLRDYTRPTVRDLRAGIALESSSVVRRRRSGFSRQMDPQVRGRAQTGPLGHLLNWGIAGLEQAPTRGRAALGLAG